MIHPRASPGTGSNRRVASGRTRVDAAVSGLWVGGEMSVGLGALGEGVSVLGGGVSVLGAGVSGSVGMTSVGMSASVGGRALHETKTRAINARGASLWKLTRGRETLYTRRIIPKQGK